MLVFFVDHMEDIWRTAYTETEMYFPIGSRTMIYELGLAEIS